MDDGYTSFELIWQDLVVVVSYQANWLSTDQWHIELRCDERLPVTETGYRSHFLADVEFANEDEILIWITEWLDQAASNPAWLRHKEDSRQLTLF